MKNPIFTLMRMSDIFSTEVHLLSQRDEKKNKTVFGGFLSVISCALIAVATFYFFLQLLQRKNATFLTSQRFGTHHNITNFNEIPFMIRIGGHATKPLENDDGEYRAWVEEWIMDEGEESQYHRIHLLEPCTREHIHEKYRQLFEKFNDLSSFKCIKWNTTTPTHLYGINGASKTANNHFDFNFRRCYHDRDQGCLPLEQINNILKSNAFLDVRQLDFEIDHESPVPHKPVVKQERLVISNTVFKKFFWNWRLVDYVSDMGFIFTERITETFFQFDSVSQTVDVRDIDDTTRNQAFIEFTVQPFPFKTIYNRNYEKAQQVISNVGGLIKFILLVGFLINFTISKRLYYSELINYIIKADEFLTKEEKINQSHGQKSTVFMNNFMALKSNNELSEMGTKNQINPLNESQVRVENIHLVAPKKLNLTTSQLICPFFCFKKHDKKINVYTKYSEIIFKNLNIRNVLAKMVEVDEMKNFIFDDNQKVLFHYLAGSHNKINDKELQIALKTCADKISKDLIDRKLLQGLKVKKT